MIPIAGVAEYVQRRDLSVPSRAMVNGFMMDARRGETSIFPPTAAIDGRHLFQHDGIVAEQLFLALYRPTEGGVVPDLFVMTFDEQSYELPDLYELTQAFLGLRQEFALRDPKVLSERMHHLRHEQMTDPDSLVWCALLVGSFPIYAGPAVAIFSRILDPQLGIYLLERALRMRFIARSK